MDCTRFTTGKLEKSRRRPFWNRYSVFKNFTQTRRRSGGEYYRKTLRNFIGTCCEKVSKRLFSARYLDRRVTCLRKRRVVFSPFFFSPDCGIRSENNITTIIIDAFAFFTFFSICLHVVGRPVRPPSVPDASEHDAFATRLTTSDCAIIHVSGRQCIVKFAEEKNARTESND